MTNADVPTIVINVIIKDPQNSFARKPINLYAKKESEQHVLSTEYWDASVNNGNTFMPGKWYSVHDNIFNMSNWSIVE